MLQIKGKPPSTQWLQWVLDKCINLSFRNFLCAASKNDKIYRRKIQKSTNNYNPNNHNKSRHIILTINSINHYKKINLTILNLKFINTTSKKIRDIFSTKRNSSRTEAGIYKTDCTKCLVVYIGEISRNLKKKKNYMSLVEICCITTL